MSKRVFSLFLLGVLALSVSFNTNAYAKKQEFSATAAMYETHPVIAGVMLPWFKMVEEATNGNVEFTFYGPGTICPVTEILPAVNSGIVDLGQSSLSMTPGRYPQFGILELPMLFESASQYSVTAQKLYEKRPELQKEMQGFFPISFAGSVPMQIVSINPIKTLADIKGKKVGITGQAQVEPIKALGANPIIMQSTDMYMGLQRGMIDALIWPVPSIFSFKLHEVAKYVTMADIVVASSFTLMNADSWNSIPEDMRKAIEPTVGMRSTLSFATCSDNFVPSDKAKLEGLGVTFIELDPAEKEKWVSAMSPIHEAWLLDMEKKGFTTIRDIYKDMVALAEEYTPEKLEALRQEIKPYNTNQ